MDYVRSTRGASLVSVLVAVGITGILALVIATMFANQLSIMKKIDQKGDMQDLRRWISVTHDCATTVSRTPATCPASGAPVALFRRGAVELIRSANINATNFTTVGGSAGGTGAYSLRAVCTSQNTFQVYYTRTPRQTNSWLPLFTIALSCPEP